MSFDRAVELFRIVDEFGPMHIVVGDGNMRDDNLDFVEQCMKDEGGGTAEERELLALLRGMSEDQRYAVDDAAYPMPED